MAKYLLLSSAVKQLSRKAKHECYVGSSEPSTTLEWGATMVDTHSDMYTYSGYIYNQYSPYSHYTYNQSIYQQHIYNQNIYNQSTYNQKSYNPNTRCPKKKGISESFSVSFTTHLMLKLEYSFIIYLKFDNHMVVPST